MTVEELQAEIRSFAQALARAMGSAEDAARTNHADKMMKALSDAKAAADDLARRL
jgi:hypothetical protein